MPIYWMRTADLYPDARFSPNSFTALDPEVRFPRFHMETGDEQIGGVDRIDAGPQAGMWQWSMTVALPGPRYGPPTHGVEDSRGKAARRMIEVYHHYLSTRPERYPKERGR